jgi:hypothetical protein
MGAKRTDLPGTEGKIGKRKRRFRKKMKALQLFQLT